MDRSMIILFLTSDQRINFAKSLYCYFFKGWSLTWRGKGFLFAGSLPTSKYFQLNNVVLRRALSESRLELSLLTRLFGTARPYCPLTSSKIEYKNQTLRDINVRGKKEVKRKRKEKEG